MSVILEAVFDLVPYFEKDMCGLGWDLDSDSEEDDGEFSIEVVEFLDENRDYCFGEEMLIKSEIMGDCGGQRHAEAVRRKMELIPHELDKCVLVFPKTVWWKWCRGCITTVLHKRHGKWRLGFDWIEGSFGPQYRIVRIRKPASST